MAATRIFLVRVQHQAAGFSASARRVDEEAARHFDQPLPLLEFLVGLPPPTPAPAAAPPGGPDEVDPAH
jgi:hypothetical protein